MKKYHFKKSGFTLVELIIVITILAILATIAFVSFSNYMGSARDAARMSNITNIEKGLAIYFEKNNKYPTPITNISTGKLNGGDFAYQGDLSAEILKDLGFNREILDQKTKNPYLYSIITDRKIYQIGATFENEFAQNSLISQTYANDYIMKVSGNFQGFAKYFDESKNCTTYINIPSILWQNINNSSVDLTQTGANPPKYLVNKLKLSDEKTPDEIIKFITQNEDTKIISICEEDLKSIGEKSLEEVQGDEETQIIIQSFGGETPQNIKTHILNDNSKTIYANCENYNHTDKYTFFKTSQVNYLQTCEPGVEFQCINGNWKSSGDEEKDDYPSAVPCVVGEPNKCEIGTKKDGFELQELLNHGSGSILFKTDTIFQNGTKILSQKYTCNNGDLEKSGSESFEIESCNTDYYKNGNICKSGIIGNDTTGRKWADNTFAKSCNEYKNPTGNYIYDGEVGDGIYYIKPDLETEFQVYCDMTTDGGGWTLVFGLGLEGENYKRDSLFWDGVDLNDKLVSYYKSYRFSSSISSKILSKIPFKDLLFDYDSSNEIFSSESSLTSFTEKKQNLESFSGLIWDFNCIDGGYTQCGYLLGRETSIVAYDDYRAYGIGLSGKASSRGIIYGTIHIFYPEDTVNCGHEQYCLYNKDYTSAGATGLSAHRHLSYIYIKGLFIK